MTVQEIVEAVGYLTPLELCEVTRTLRRRLDEPPAGSPVPMPAGGPGPAAETQRPA